MAASGMCQGWYTQQFVSSGSYLDCQNLCSKSHNCGATTFEDMYGSTYCASDPALPHLFPPSAPPPNRASGRHTPTALLCPHALRSFLAGYMHFQNQAECETAKNVYYSDYDSPSCDDNSGVVVPYPANFSQNGVYEPYSTCYTRVFPSPPLPTSSVRRLADVCPDGYFDSTDGNGLAWECGTQNPSAPYGTRGNCAGIPNGDYTDYFCGCACEPDPPCSDTNNGARDSNEDACSSSTDCFSTVYDDDDFTAADMCCICGGGASPSPSPPPSPPPSPQPSAPLPEVDIIVGLPSSAVLATDYAGLLTTV